MGGNDFQDNIQGERKYRVSQKNTIKTLTFSTILSSINLDLDKFLNISINFNVLNVYHIFQEK